MVRLPFKDTEAKTLAQRTVEELGEDTVLFLGKVKSLWIETPRTRRYVTRESRKLPDLGGARQIDIELCVDETDDTDSRQYWLWQWEMGGENNPEEAEKIREAVSDLPGKWPQVEKADVSLAVRLGEIPEKGVINIFLPTEHTSGAACHLNAPFYGDISRKDVDFKKPYNELLIEKAAHRAAHIITHHLAGKGLPEARAILDILVPATTRDTNEKIWFSLIRKKFSESGTELEKVPLLLTSKGWQNLVQARLSPQLDEPKVFTKDRLFQKAAFAAIHLELVPRTIQLQNLYAFTDTRLGPEESWLASTIETIAA